MSTTFGIKIPSTGEIVPIEVILHQVYLEIGRMKLSDIANIIKEYCNTLPTEEVMELIKHLLLKMRKSEKRVVKNYLKMKNTLEM